MGANVNNSVIDPYKCWICELKEQHHKKIDAARRIHLYICSEKCREVFMQFIKDAEDKQRENEKVKLETIEE